jgi:hypothetical protein
MSYLRGEIASWEASLQYGVEPRSIREAERLSTGYFKIGRRVSDRKVLSLFVAMTGLRRDLRERQVWRAGIEFVDDFF